MTLYSKEINENYVTNAGDYTIVSNIACGGLADNRLEVYLGRAISDGHYDLLVSDNAGIWVLGDDNDFDLNRDQWRLVFDRCGDIDLSVVRSYDDQLADWLDSRRADSVCASN